MTLKEIKKFVTISEGNMKLGKIPSVSLPPVKTCRKDVGCHKVCYAMKSFRLYPSVRDAYEKNLNTATNNPEKYFELIQSYIDIKKPSYFRFHVAGDIPNAEYFEHMVALAKRNPNVKFLCYTKKYDIPLGKHLNFFAKIKNMIKCRIPKNFSVVLSSWPNTKLPKLNRIPIGNSKMRFPIAFFDDGTDSRITNTLTCPGSCENCKICYDLKGLGKNVKFIKH